MTDDFEPLFPTDVRPNGEWCDWDAKGQTGIHTVHGVLGAEEKACGVMVASFAIRATQKSGGRAADSAVAHGMSRFRNEVKAQKGAGYLSRKCVELLEDELAPWC